MSLRRASRSVTIAGLVLALAGCSPGGSGPTTVPQNFQAGSVTIVPPARRKLPVVMAGTTLAGQRLDLALLRGHPVC